MDYNSLRVNLSNGRWGTEDFRDLKRSLVKMTQESLASFLPLTREAYYNNPIQVIDFFSGAGGTSLGFAALNNVVDIQSSIQDIVDNMLEDFEIKYGREFNDKNNVDLSDMNKLVNNNSNKYFNQYSKNLEKYGMEVIFINNE